MDRLVSLGQPEGASGGLQGHNENPDDDLPERVVGVLMLEDDEAVAGAQKSRKIHSSTW